MKIPSQLIAASLLAMVWLPAATRADEPVKHVPQKAAPTAPQTKPVLTNTAVRQAVMSPTLKPKPPVATAVAPKFPVSPVGQRGIIFVGGKPSEGKSALNPQPIPPGHGPGDPVH